MVTRDQFIIIHAMVDITTHYNHRPLWDIPTTSLSIPTHGTATGTVRLHHLYIYQYLFVLVKYISIRLFISLLLLLASSFTHDNKCLYLFLCSLAWIYTVSYINTFVSCLFLCVVLLYMDPVHAYIDITYLIHSFWLVCSEFSICLVNIITDLFHFVFLLLINILFVVFDICVRSDTKHQRSSFYFFFFSLLFLFEYESF
eukprot:382973_1